MTEERHSSPLRSPSSTAGYFRMSSAAVFRYCAAPADSFSSRRRKSKSDAYPSSVHLRSASKTERAMRNSARAWCSERSRSARREVSSRAVQRLVHDM
jgi:hypothetical protein